MLNVRSDELCDIDFTQSLNGKIECLASRGQYSLLTIHRHADNSRYICQNITFSKRLEY